MNKRRRMTARELSRGLFLVAVTVGLLSACGGSADNGLPGRTASVQPPTVSLSFERTPSSETDAIPPVTSTISASSPDVTTRTPILGQSSDPSTAVSSAEHTESSTTQTQVASPEPSVERTTTTTTIVSTETSAAVPTPVASPVESSPEPPITGTTDTAPAALTPVTATPAPSTTSTSSTLSAQPTTEPATWPWWLLGAVILGVAVAIPVLIARRRRNGWRERLALAESEIVWFARQLLPQLQQQQSVDQVAGAWQVTRDRVSALEDTLTGLQSTARRGPDEALARNLRDSVRAARIQLDDVAAALGPMAPPADITTTRDQIGAAILILETAIAGPQAPPPQDAGADAENSQ